MPVRKSRGGRRKKPFYLENEPDTFIFRRYRAGKAKWVRMRGKPRSGGKKRK